MQRSVVSTSAAPAAIGPYSQGIIAGQHLLFTAGQIPINPGSGELVTGDIRLQTRQVLENLAAILREGGATLASVVKTTVFLKDMTEFGAMNEVYAEYFRTAPPARSTVEVSRLPRDVRVEIEAVALIDRT